MILVFDTGPSTVVFVLCKWPGKIIFAIPTRPGGTRNKVVVSKNGFGQGYFYS